VGRCESAGSSSCTSLVEGERTGILAQASEPPATDRSISNPASSTQPLP
jgi:hypothetical protein